MESSSRATKRLGETGSWDARAETTRERVTFTRETRDRGSATPFVFARDAFDKHDATRRWETFAGRRVLGAIRTRESASGARAAIMAIISCACSASAVWGSAEGARGRVQTVERANAGYAEK
jgi:hypothetical protein